ncbi:hypothetical protein M436DRAFT_86332 [Aureobasidium namibiae CBS 147.97]|uniref:Uncharacterized protein n=1 Tax=Aureobasidium namibiae CBS 147.97 TaxID=1043004 RepID=A0A074W661_9PEZI
MTAVARVPGGGGDDEDPHNTTPRLPADRVDVVPEAEETRVCNRCRVRKPIAEFAPKQASTARSSSRGPVKTCLKCRGGDLMVKKRRGSEPTVSSPLASSAKRQEICPLAWPSQLGVPMQPAPTRSVSQYVAQTLGHAVDQQAGQTIAQTLLDLGAPSRAHTPTMGPPPTRGRGMTRGSAITRTQSASPSRTSSPSRSLVMDVTTRAAERAASMRSPGSGGLGSPPPPHTSPGQPFGFQRSSPVSGRPSPLLSSHTPPGHGTGSPGHSASSGSASSIRFLHTTTSHAVGHRDLASAGEYRVWFICEACNHARAEARRATVSGQVDFCQYCEQGISGRPLR